MSRPHSVKSIRSDGLAVVCAWCDSDKAGLTWCEERNLEVTHGVCPACRVKFCADSLKGSVLDLGITAGLPEPVK